MKTILPLIVFILFSGNIFAQKIKINGKTGIVTLDNVGVANLRTTKDINDQYVFSFRSLHSEDSVQIEIIQVGKPEDNFLNVSSNISDKTSEMDYEMINFTLNINSVIANLIINKYNFFDTGGMNRKSILDFLDREDHTRQDELDRLKSKLLVDRAKIASYSPIIKKNKTVVNNTTNEIIASFAKATGKTKGTAIKDIYGNELAVLVTNEVDRSPVYSLKTFDERTFFLTKQKQIDIISTAIDTLIANNYMGNDSNSYNIRKPIFDEEMITLDKKRAIDQIEDRKRSKVDGILTLTNGDSIKGIFDIKFRQTPQGILSTAYVNNTIIDPDPENRSIDLYGKDNEIEKKYNGGKIKSFKVINNESRDSTELYVQIKYIEEPVPAKKVPILASDGTIDLFGAGKSFIDAQLWDVTKKSLAYQAFDSDSTTLYFMYQNIFVKNKSNDRIVMLNAENFNSQLGVIANHCQEVLDRIGKGIYIFSRESILNFVRDREKCK